MLVGDQCGRFADLATWTREADRVEFDPHDDSAGILGLVLKQIFELSIAAPVLALAALMTIVAGVSAVRRIDIRFASIYPTAIFAVWASSWIVTAVTVLMIVRPQPWHSPQVVIPLLGMVLGKFADRHFAGFGTISQRAPQPSRRGGGVALTWCHALGELSRGIRRGDSDRHDSDPEHDVGRGNR